MNRWFQVIANNLIFRNKADKTGLHRDIKTHIERDQPRSQGFFTLLKVRKPWERGCERDAFNQQMKTRVNKITLAHLKLFR